MGAGDVENIIREYLARKTPDGYYVIPAKPGAREILEKYNGIIVEEAGPLLFAKTRSRSIAEKILRKLYRLELLEEY